MPKLFMILLLLPLQSLQADVPCAQDLAGVGQLLGLETMNPVWTETTADDGKPMILRLSERDGALWLEFDKTQEGLWASGVAAICQDANAVEARISKDAIELGDAAPWVVRMGMGGGVNFQIRPLEGPMLRVFTMGWEGDFRPGE